MRGSANVYKGVKPNHLFSQARAHLFSWDRVHGQRGLTHQIFLIQKNPSGKETWLARQKAPSVKTRSPNSQTLIAKNALR